VDADRNLLFGVLALQADLIDHQQFVEACLLWTSRKDAAMADLLLERGWIAPEDRTHVDYLLGRKLYKHGGDPRASLAALPDDVKRSLAAVDDADIRRTFGDAARPGHAVHEAVTIDHHSGLPAAPGDRYTRLRLHACGGIGRIWVAHDRELGRNVALKELKPEQAANAALRARFLQEARITGQLEHPGTVPVYELAVGRDDRQPFYTMQFVNGRTLSEAARDYHERRAAGRADALGLPALLNAFVTVCNTVAYAHSRGVIHRDLKGQNVILGDFGEVLVLDWGLAKRVDRPEGEPLSPPTPPPAAEDSGQTVQGQALGTPAYMAPEQAAGRLDLIDRRTDVYGLGAVLYEILTGQPPFCAADTYEVLRRVQEDPPPPPRTVWPDVPPALEAVCLKALAKQPEDRPAAAAELAQEVQGWQEYERRKAEQALRESEALYHSLVECLPCNVFRKDLEGRFTFANQRFCDHLGRPLEQILGKTNFEFNPPELAEKYRRDDRQVIQTGQVLEDVEDHAGKRQRYVHILKTAVRDAAGKIVGVQGISWDVTERKLAEDALARERYLLHSLMDTIPDLIYFKDRAGHYLRVNECLAETFRSRGAGEVLGKTLADVFPPEYARQAEAEDQEIFRTGRPVVARDVKVTWPDGSVTWVSTTKMPLRDPNGEIVGTCGIARNITDRKRFEEELRRTAERLAYYEQQHGRSPAPDEGGVHPTDSASA
jgi:PAS domain S-box-containing protein